jgi:hypothetical protein
MFYLLLKDYTHHGGTIKKLKTIPEGTLISKEAFREKLGLEYITIGHGNQEGFYLSKEVVENNPEFFKKLTEQEFNKFIAIEKFKNDLYLANEYIPTNEIQDIVRDTLQLKSEEPDPREEFLKRLEEIQKEAEKIADRNTIPFTPFPTMPLPEYNNKCHCGNDGTTPCWSTACPKRIIITYGTGTRTPNPGMFWTSSYTINNTNKKNNDQ